MTDQTMASDATQASHEAGAPAVDEFNAEASMASAVGFADAETREILNLLGSDTDAPEGGCCGGGCCSAS